MRRLYHGVHWKRSGSNCKGPQTHLERQFLFLFLLVWKLPDDNLFLRFVCRKFRIGIVSSIGQVVDTRVLGKLDTWSGSGKAWPNWSFVTKAHGGAVDQQLARDITSAEISTDVVSNVQLGGV